MKKDVGFEKIITVDSAVRKIRQYKKQGKKIGCLSGSFDLVTAVHFKAFFERSRFCDVMFVLLNSDESVRMYKGEYRPIVGESERSYVIAQSPYVDHVILFDDMTPVNILGKLKPDIFFNVPEWGENCIERKVVEENRGIIKLFDFDIPDNWYKSSSSLVNRIRNVGDEIGNKAIFLDRDGVINDDKNGYIYKWSDFVILPHVIASLRRFQKAGFQLFIITNQSGIGRGMFTERDVQKLHRRVLSYFRTEGVTIKAVYYCPHRPDEQCVCRKPSPGMLLQAAKDHHLNLSKSWLIGDKGSDIDAGRQANIHTVLVRNSKITREQEGEFKPNIFVDTLKQAADHIISKNQ